MHFTQRTQRLIRKDAKFYSLSETLCPSAFVASSFLPFQILDLPLTIVDSATIQSKIVNLKS